MIDKIIAYNKTFVESKGYEKYLTDKPTSILTRNWRYFRAWTPV